jgi:hypothetical protein
MRTKIIDLNDEDYPLAKGEKRITPFVETNYGYEINDLNQKTAACNEAVEFASTIEPQPGKRVILVSALGDFEHYEANKKGDAFPYNAIMGMMPKDVSRDFFGSKAGRIPPRWGYQCFVTIFNDQGYQIGGGNTFYEHMNRTPKHLLGLPVDMNNKQDPRCGYILAAFWNPVMHRVEIVQEVWEEKLPHIVHAIDRGELPGISMACDIPFDRCHECGNIAVTQQDYCEHLNRMAGPRGAIYESGRGGIMINDFPIFFDSTITKNPAATEGRTLMKVASLVGPDKTFRYSKTKSACLEMIEPDIPDGSCNCDFLQRLRLDEPAFDFDTIQRLKEFKLNKLLMYLSLLGIVPTGRDLIRYLFNDFSPFGDRDGLLVEQLMAPVVKGVTRISVQIIKRPEPVDRFDENEFNKILDIVSPYMPQKSYLLPYFYSRPKIASVTNLPLVPMLANQRVKEIIQLREAHDRVTLSLLDTLRKNRELEELLRKNDIEPQDFDYTHMPIYRVRGKNPVYSLYSWTAGE